MNIIDKPVKTDQSMPTVPVKQLRLLTNKTKELDSKEPLSLQLVLTALFPTVWNNIQKYCNDCYTSGYLQGLSDAKNEN